MGTGDHAYTDDILIASSSSEEHKLHLRQLFESLDQYRITINPKKCTSGQAKIDLLSHHIDTHGISPLPEKTQSIMDYPISQSVKSLRRFLCAVNY